MNAGLSFTEHLGPSSAVELVGREVIDPKISLRDVKKRLSYSKETGVFTWINISKYHSERQGKKAGSLQDGYLVLQVDGWMVRAHRLAWFFEFGYMPNVIDHINGLKTDNRIANLRNVTNLQNAQNHSKIKTKKDGLPVGVKALKSGNFQARATVNGRCFALGSFKTKEQAHERYKKFTKRNHDAPAVSRLV